MMENKNQLAILKEELNGGGNGYKIINEEIKDQPENIYAVCTPVKIQ